MTVGELKKTLQETPDDFRVQLVEQRGTSFILRDLACASELRTDTGEYWNMFALIRADELLSIELGRLIVGHSKTSGQLPNVSA